MLSFVCLLALMVGILHSQCVADIRLNYKVKYSVCYVVLLGHLVVENENNYFRIRSGWLFVS